MSEQTPEKVLSEEEVRGAIQDIGDTAAMTPQEVQEKLAKLAFWKNQGRLKGKRDRALIRTAAKMKKKRVIKPKPLRRPKEFCTIISIAGEPVEGLEDAFINLS